AHGTIRDGVEDRLGVRGGVADDAEDPAGGRFPLQGLRLTLQRLREALLQIGDPGVLVLARFTGNRWLRFPGLGGLRTPTHQPLLASYEGAEHRLGEPVCRGKGAANRKLSLLK